MALPMLKWRHCQSILLFNNDKMWAYSLLNSFDISIIAAPLSLDKTLEICVISATVILFNTTMNYFILYGLIVGSLQVNFIRSLIYKVINLGVLSVFVVALWAILTEPNFIYVVYVLAFVGAVIMLFLSVILMLPSSVIAPSTYAISAFLSLQVAPGDSGATSNSFLWSFTSTLFCVFILLATIYFCLAVYVSATEDLNKVYKLRKPAECVRAQEITYPPSSGPLNADQKGSHNLRFWEYINSHTFYAHDCLEYNDLAIKECRRNYFIYSVGNCGARFGAAKLEMRPMTDAMTPLYLVAEPTMNRRRYASGGRLAVKLLRVLYEFFEYYVRIIEPYFLVVNASRFNFFVQLTYPLRRLVGARHWKSKGDLRDYLVRNGQRCALEVKEKGTGRKILIMYHTPWWSPFNVIPKIMGRTKTSPVRPHLGVFIYTQEKLSIYNYSLSRVFLVLGALPQYGPTVLSFHVAIFSAINLVVSALKALFGYIARIRSAFLESSFQFIHSVSIFILSTPTDRVRLSAPGYSGNLGVENLAAIQHIIYAVDPLLLLTSVTGLLVALVGAAALSS